MKHGNLFWIIFLLIFLPVISAAADKGGPYSTEPITNNGKKWRIGYYEGGNYINYPANLVTLSNGLAELKWLNKSFLPGSKDFVDAKSFWNIISQKESKYIEFIEEAFWSADWDPKKREQTKASALQYLGKEKLDLIIAMGTWAGQDLSNNAHSVPVMVVSTSNPVQSKIIANHLDSGFDHVHAKCDPTRYLRQVRTFHNMVGFKKLGIVYEDSVDGRTYGGVNEVKQVAREKFFEVVSCEAPFSGIDKDEATKRVIECHEELAPKVDALYLTVHRGIEHKQMAEILEPLFHNKIPTFSMRGPVEVKYGALMSVSRQGFDAVGRYHAEVAAKIFNGAKPRDLSQVFEDPKKISINIKSAEKINFIIPPVFLKIADEIFKDIEAPE